MNGDSAKAKAGSNLTIAGISLQLLWFIFFVIVAAFFHYQMRLSPTSTAQHRNVRWEKYLRSLYFVSIMIVIRSAFRLVEYAEGFTGYLQSHEAFFYVFDSMLMLVVMVWMNWQHHPVEISLLLRAEDSKMAERSQVEPV
jgi:uncharacterized membrane protein